MEKETAGEMEKAMEKMLRSVWKNWISGRRKIKEEIRIWREEMKEWMEKKERRG